MTAGGNNIAIIGSGPAGLSAALYLRRQGKNVTIFEQFDSPRPVGSGLMLQPTGLSVLHDLGLLDAVLKRGQRVDRILGKDAFTDKKVLNVYYDKLSGGRFGLGTHRHCLFEVLFEQACKEGVVFEFETTISRLETGASGVRPIDENDKVLAKFDLVIVASGSNSTIANEMFNLPEIADLPYGAYWATLNWPEGEFNKNMLEQRYRGASIMVGVLPLGAVVEEGAQIDKAALFWSAKGCDVAALDARGLDAWKDDVQKYWPQTSVLVDQISAFSDLTFANYRHFTLKRPYDRRVIFIGDSYHSTSPQLGQGANMALLDAMALDIAVKSCGRDFDGLGEAYYRLRGRQIRIFQFLSSALTPFYQSDSRVLGFIRDHLVSELVKIPPAPRLMAEMVSGMFAGPFSVGLLPKASSIKLKEPDWFEFG